MRAYDVEPGPSSGADLRKTSLRDGACSKLRQREMEHWAGALRALFRMHQIRTVTCPTYADKRTLLVDGRPRLAMASVAEVSTDETWPITAPSTLHQSVAFP